MDRYVLCRPQGGLNDILDQVEKCCRYGESFGRDVIIDTDYRHAGHFRSPFADFFVSRQPDILLSNPFSDAELDGMDALPDVLQGRVSSYEARWNAETKRVQDPETGVPVTFDFDRDHPQRLLVHQQVGGGPRSAYALLRLRLHDRLADRLVERLKVLPPRYAAIHIRHTDLKTDYRSALQAVRAQDVRHLFIGTDNAEVVQAARAILDRTEVYSFAELPMNGGKPLHIQPDRAEAASRNADAILDLFTLSLAQTLFMVRVMNENQQLYSGFTRLAQALNANRSVLRRVLDRPDLLRIMQAHMLRNEVP